MQRAVIGRSLPPVSVGWAVAFTLLLVLLAWYRPRAICSPNAATEPPAGQEDPVTVEAALAAWQEMWKDLEAEGVDALDPGLNVPGAQYAGDTCGMRYRRLYRDVTPAARERLVIAAFANDPRVKQRVLEPLLASPSESTRGRAAVELARVALRNNAPGQADAALDETIGLGMPEVCEADVHYLRGRAALHRGEMDAALDALTMATDRDRGYWNAWRDQVPILVHALHETPQRTSDCLNRTRRLIEILGLLPQLANDTGQFGKLALSMERLGAHSSSTLLAAGVMWRWAGQVAHGRSVLVRALNTPPRLPPTCEREIRARIVRELEDA